MVAFAQDVIILEKGRVRKADPMEELQGTNDYVSTSKQAIEVSNDTIPDQDIMTSLDTGGESRKDACSSSNEQANDLNRRNGDLSVYKYFSKASGHVTVFGIFVFLALCVFCAEFSSKLYFLSAKIMNIRLLVHSSCLD